MKRKDMGGGRIVNSFDLLSMSKNELEELLKDVISHIKIKSYKNGYDQGRFDAEMDRVSEVVNEDYKDTQQKERERIVEQAKRDVVSMTTKDRRSYRGNECFKRSMSFSVTEEFIVNREKRTVVCLLKDPDTDEVLFRGIAKCMPEDCFNIHIGKVISLYRALGYGTMDSYLTAPQPAEVKVGDIVEFYSEYTSELIYKRVIEIEMNNDLGEMIWFEDGTWADKCEVKVVDDSDSL